MAKKKARRISANKLAKLKARKKAAAAEAAARKPRKAKTSAPAIRKKMNRVEIVESLADSTGLTKKQVQAVMDEYENLIERSIKKRGVGEFTLPGLMKITTVKKPARKARKGVNPLTGEETMFKARPATIDVKVRPLKKLKEFASGGSGTGSGGPGKAEEGTP